MTESNTAAFQLTTTAPQMRGFSFSPHPINSDFLSKLQLTISPFPIKILICERGNKYGRMTMRVPAKIEVKGYCINATLEDGRRFMLLGTPYDLMRVSRIARKIEAVGTIDLSHWSEIDPVVGSPAYRSKRHVDARMYRTVVAAQLAGVVQDMIARGV